jgi:MFS family permease
MLVTGLLAGRIYYISLELTLKLQHEGKGAKAGIFEGIIGLGSGLIPIISGLLAEKDLSLPFYIVGILCIIFAVICFILAVNNRKKK